MAKPDICDRPISPFQGLHLLCQASTLREEAQCLETAGLQKVEMVVAGSKAEGLYRLLRGALSHSPRSMAQPPTKRCHQAPTTTVSKPPPQEPEEVEPEYSAPVAEGGLLAQDTPSLKALEVAIHANMAPLCLNVEGSKGSVSTGLRGVVRDHPSVVWPFVLMCTGSIWV